MEVYNLFANITQSEYAELLISNPRLAIACKKVGEVNDLNVNELRTLARVNVKGEEFERFSAIVSVLIGTNDVLQGLSKYIPDLDLDVQELVEHIEAGATFINSVSATFKDVVRKYIDVHVAGKDTTKTMLDVLALSIELFATTIDKDRLRDLHNKRRSN